MLLTLSHISHESHGLEQPWTSQNFVIFTEGVPDTGQLFSLTRVSLTLL